MAIEVLFYPSLQLISFIYPLLLYSLYLQLHDNIIL